MWTDTTRAHHARAGLALPSDLNDGEWAVLKPFLPPPSFVGRPRKWPMRRIVEAILDLLRGGLPHRRIAHPIVPQGIEARAPFEIGGVDDVYLARDIDLTAATPRQSVLGQIAVRIDKAEAAKRQNVLPDHRYEKAGLAPA